MRTPYKMKGYSYPGNSPVKNKGNHERDSKEERKTIETRGKNTITKTKGDRSSTYTKTKSTKNKDGSITEVYTNDLGNTETRNVSSPLPNKGHGYDDIKHAHKVRPAGYKGKNNSTNKRTTTKTKTKTKKPKKPDFPPIGVEVVI
tara:strand:- start:7 stop:441 length:435 start_codon:yes stop_codon:yes gene_type:complete